MDSWLGTIVSLPMQTSQELRWGIVLGMAIGGGIVALYHYLKDLRRQHIDKLVDEKVERILALVEQKRADIECRVKEEIEAKGKESTRSGIGSPSSSSSSSPSSSASSNNSSISPSRSWEQKKPLTPASRKPSPLAKPTVITTPPTESSSSSPSPTQSASSSPSGTPSAQSGTDRAAAFAKSERPKLMKSQSTIWRGEDEATLRKRQNLERQSSMQKLYGMEAEIAKKIEKKTEPLIEPMCKWLHEVVGEEVSGEFPDCLKSGRLLCALMNKLWPGIIPEVHARPIPLLERENIQKYLDACAKMGIRSDDLFGVNDLYDEKYLAAVVQNVYAVARYAQQRKTWDGPILNPPPVEKAELSG